MVNDPSCGGYKVLALATILQAVRDLKSNDLPSSLDAAMFLTGDDFPLWAEAAGIPDANGYSLLIGGNKWMTKALSAYSME